MSSHHLNNSFIKRFQDKPVHLGITEKRYNDLLIHQFTGDNKDILPLLSPLAGKLNDNEIVQRLMSKLIRKDIPATKCMLCFIQYLQHKLKNYDPEEPYTSRFCAMLQVEFTTFHSLIEAFQEKILIALLRILEIVNSKKATATGTIYGEDVCNVSGEIECYLDLVGKYHDYFNMLWQKELQRAAITVLSDIGENLSYLTDKIEKVLAESGNTKYLLKKWKTKLINRELQQTYN